MQSPLRTGLHEDEEERMRQNGETKAQMRHVTAMKAAGGVSLDPSFGDDTSRDQPWKYDHSDAAKTADNYVLCITVLWLGPKLLIFAVPTLISHVLPMMVARVYMIFVPENTESVERSSAFYLAFALAIVVSLPAIAIVLLSLLLDTLMYYVFGLLYCTITWRWSRVARSLEHIRPYRGGPSIVWRLPDFFVAVMGQCARQSPGETLWMVSVMWLLIPWLKYWVNCNPLVFDLDSRLVQQISARMDDLGTPSECAGFARGIISRAKQCANIAGRIDLWSFVPHYPYPPPGRRWALGLQAGGSSYPGKFTLVVHTTHAVKQPGGPHAQFVLSNCVKEPIYRVMLWYSNPFHFLTGWVEASISTGLPSEIGKPCGGEHPMWLVTGRTPLVAGRDSWTGSGMIDAFFDYWLPVFVHEMRRQFYSNLYSGHDNGEQRALEIANAMYQEVHSKDGVSNLRLEYGIHESQTDASRMLVSDEAVLREHGLRRFWGEVSRSEFGGRVAQLQQGRRGSAQSGLDVHHTAGDFSFSASSSLRKRKYEDDDAGLAAESEESTWEFIRPRIERRRLA